MVYFIVIGVLSVALAVLSGIFNVKGRPLLRLLTKMAASLAFVAVGLVALGLHGSVALYEMLVLTALLCGMLGDIFLCLHGCASPESRHMFDAIGMAFFAIGHIFFIAIFFSLAPLYWWLLAFVVIPPVALFICMRLKILKGGKMAIPMLVYSVMLGLMVISAVNAYLHLQDTATLVSLIAAALFALSDSTLSFKDYSIRWKDNPVLIQVVLIPYYVAQCLFAITIWL